MLLGVGGIILAGENTFGQYLSLFVFKPAIKLLMAFQVMELSFRKINFQHEIKERNMAAGLVFVGVCIILGWVV